MMKLLLMQFSPLPVTSSLLDLNTFLSTLFPSTLSLFQKRLAHENLNYSYRKIQQDATVCQNLLFLIYMKLNMFRATHRPSSGAKNCTSSLWFCIRERLLDVWLLDAVRQGILYSTCFGRHTAHHQEPKSALAASGFAYVKGCWTCGCWTLSGRVYSTQHVSGYTPPIIRSLKLH